MKITESKLRSIIRSVIRESSQEELEHLDVSGNGYIPNVKKIGSAYFRHLHVEHGEMSPQEWADANLHMSKYKDVKMRQSVLDMLEEARKSADAIHYSR